MIIKGFALLRYVRVKDMIFKVCISPFLFLPGRKRRQRKVPMQEKAVHNLVCGFPCSAIICGRFVNSLRRWNQGVPFRAGIDKV